MYLESCVYFWLYVCVKIACNSHLQIFPTVFATWEMIFRLKLSGDSDNTQVIQMNVFSFLNLFLTKHLALDKCESYRSFRYGLIYSHEGPVL